MKILGLASTGYSNKKYICEVDHSELEKFLNLYYGNLKDVKAGDEIDLGKGYDFYGDTKAALEKTQAFIAANQRVIETIFSGIEIMARPSVEVQP